jgi:sterol desaturase/sphingolipid hydroxylase (fatty acid hydroxylase superfamily)
VALLLLFEVADKAARWIMASLSQLPIGTTAQEFLWLIVPVALITLPLMLAERLRPGTSLARGYVKGAKFFLLYWFFFFAWSKVGAWFGALAPAWPAPLINERVVPEVDDPLHPFVIAGSILISVWTTDFFYYWFHRLQHRIPVFWQVHKVHHSITDLNCINMYHHFLELVIRVPFIVVPVALLLHIDMPRLFLLSAFVLAWGQYIHSDTSIHLGKLGAVFSDNAHHRLHHSILPRHYNKNFASFFPAWDRLFGTYLAPEPGQIVEVGLVDVPPPETMTDYIAMPFRAATSASTKGTSGPPSSFGEPSV